ncbi:protein of unknown function [Streptomyces murinus]
MMSDMDVKGRLPRLVGGLCPCAPGRIRTCDTRFRRAVLYPLSYEGGARPTGYRIGARVDAGFGRVGWVGEGGGVGEGR